MMDQSRYIDNPFVTIYNVVDPSMDQLSLALMRIVQRFISHSKLPTLIAIASQVKQSEQDITAYTGVSGYTYTLLRLYHYFNSKFSVDANRSSLSQISDTQKSMFTDPQFYLEKANQQNLLLLNLLQKNPPTKKDISFYMSATMIHLCAMHLAFIRKQLAHFRNHQNVLRSIFANIISEPRKFVYQVLYGVPGFLFALLQIHNTYKKEDELYRVDFRTQIRQLSDLILDQGLRGYQLTTKTKVANIDQLPHNFRLVYVFGTRQYFGGAHGVAGVLNILFIAAQQLNDMNFNMRLEKLTTPSLKYLTTKFINGNFTTSEGSTKTKLVHFCHGAPGIVQIFARFINLFPQKAVQIAAKQILEASLNTIWKFGVLKKGYGLCHGISGNGYAFIAPAVLQALPEKANELRKKACLFALLLNQPNVMNTIKQYKFQDRFVKGMPDFPSSLMLGTAGDICFLIDCITGKAAFPGFDF